MAQAMRVAWVLVIVAWSASARADGLQDEVYLHPLDAFTAQTLHAGEVLYAQPVSPLPGWAQVGVTDDLTTEVDVTALLGGFFIAPHLPVPSFNVRYRVRDGGRARASIAVEGMAQYLWHPYAQEDFPTFRLVRDKLGGFLHVNASVPVAEHLWLHLSAGASYADLLAVQNLGRAGSHQRVFRDLVSPDVSVSLDERWTPWLSVHATASYGATFVYADNQPRKLQLAYGLRIAPLRHSTHAILRDLRLELAALVLYRPDARELQALYIPLLPYAYWQWQWH